MCACPKFDIECYEDTKAASAGLCCSLPLQRLCDAADGSCCPGSTSATRSFVFCRASDTRRVARDSDSGQNGIPRHCQRGKSRDPCYRSKFRIRFAAPCPSGSGELPENRVELAGRSASGNRGHSCQRERGRRRLNLSYVWRSRVTIDSETGAVPPVRLDEPANGC